MLRVYRYEQIAEELKGEIATGVFDDQRLPSERRLMERFGVQRDTVRRALALLAAEGRITISDRRGAFVTRTPTESEGAPVAGTILVIAAWNSSSTAQESLLRGLAQALAPTPHLTMLYFDSRARQGLTHFETPGEAYLRANHVVGIITWAQSPPDVPDLRRLRSWSPLVLVDRLVAGFEADSVGFDNIEGGRKVTEHLIANGHRRIGFLGDEAFAESVQQRWHGYTLALEAAGIGMDVSRVALFQGMSEPTYSATVRLLLAGNGTPLTAVVCSNDSVAMGLLRYLRREGLRVPEDVAVTGYGDLLPNSTEALRLTTVAQSFEAVGRTAGEIMLSRLRSPQESGEAGEPRQAVLPVRLVARASSGSHCETGSNALPPASWPAREA